MVELSSVKVFSLFKIFYYRYVVGLLLLVSWLRVTVS